MEDLLRTTIDDYLTEYGKKPSVGYAQYLDNLTVLFRKELESERERLVASDPEPDDPREKERWRTRMREILEEHLKDVLLPSIGG